MHTAETHTQVKPLRIKLRPSHGPSSTSNPKPQTITILFSFV